MKYDILIRNGRVFDPANGMDLIADVGISEGRIVEIGSISGDAPKVIDADGLFVSPGLIDLHVHLFPYSDIGLEPDLYLIPNGVTSACDAGSLGWGNYENMRFYSALRKVTIKNFINVSGVGFSVNGFPDQVNLDMDKGRGKDALRKLFAMYPEELAGLKIRVAGISLRDMGEEPLLVALEMAEELGVRIMVHISDTTIPLDRLASLMRPGDILTHCFNDKGKHTILNEDGKVYPEVWEARKRGVLFDVGNARAHFGFATGLRAIEQGFLPDTLSTDSTKYGAYKSPLMFSLPMVMSKFVAMGMSIAEVIACCTANAAKAVLFRMGTGTLSIGAPADITVIKICKKDFVFEDHRGTKVVGNCLIKPVSTIKDGDLLWRDIEY